MGQVHDLEVEKVALLQARKKGMPTPTTNPKHNPNPIPNQNPRVATNGD
jgi:hypothetical protein